MSSPSLETLEAESNALVEGIHASHLEPIAETLSATKRIKLSARDLLATLSGKRISITQIELVGKGSQGGAYADVVVATFVMPDGRRDEGRKVAVKKLRLVLSGGMTEEKFLRIFVNELRVLDKLSHPNIVEIIGFVEDIENRVAWLVFPWEENGNLREFLRSGEWEIPERVSLIQDVTLGLDYLHTRRPPICHGDLKSLNILVNSSNRAVITDFGSARIIRQVREVGANAVTHPPAPARHHPPQLSITTSNTVLTLTGPACSLRWSPPEVLNGEPLDLAADIWALGWIAWEAITDCYPFEELNREWDITMKIIEGRLPLIHGHTQLSQIYPLCSMMQICWKLEPGERPSATECMRTLKWMPSIIPVLKSGEQSKIRSAALLLRVGEMHCLQNRREEASKAYKEGLAIARLAGDQATVGSTLAQLAKNERGRSKYIEAEALYVEALSIYGRIGHDLGRADALHGLGDVQRARSRYIEAEASYTQALVICERIGYYLGRANVLLGLGLVQRARSMDVRAEASYTQALAIYESIGSDLGRGNTLLGLGDIQRGRSRLIEAEASYTQALVIFQSIGDNQGRANVLRGLGGVQVARSKYIEAEASYTQALDFYQNIGDKAGRANALIGIGDVQRLRSKYVEAEASYTLALDIYESIGGDLGRANTLLGLGHVQRARSKYVEAETSLTQALAICETIGYNLGRANVLLGLGQVQRARSEYVDAEASFTQALNVYRDIGDNAGQANALIGNGDVQRALSKYVEAETSYTQAMAIYERIEDDLGRVNSSLGLSQIRLQQARYSEAKTLINNAAMLSEHIAFAPSKALSKRFLEEVLEAERSCTKPSPSH